MTYRDDKEQLEAKNAELEAELAQARRRIAELSGERANEDVPGEYLEHSKVLGVPSSVRLVRALDFEITDPGYEAIAALLEERLSIQVSQVGTTLSDAGAFHLIRKNGATQISLRGDWSHQVSGVFVASGMVGVFGGFVATGVLHDVLRLTDGATGLSLLATVPLFASLVFTGMRARSRTQAETFLRSYRGTLAAILELAEKHRAKPKVRVEGMDEVDEAEAGAQSRNSQGRGSRGTGSQGHGA